MLPERGIKKSHLLRIYQGVRQWFLHERENGMFVDREDCFVELDERIKLYYERMCTSKNAGQALSKRDYSSMSAAEIHIKATSFEHKRCLKNREQKKSRLMSFMKARLLKPQRLVDISTDEERRRLEQTWKLMDERLHLCASGAAEQLKKQVGDPESFIKQRKDLAILQSDQKCLYTVC